jgi:trimeric autotransporter adhesin
VRPEAYFPEKRLLSLGSRFTGNARNMSTVFDERRQRAVVITVIAKAFWDVGHAPKDQSNREKDGPSMLFGKFILSWRCTSFSKSRRELRFFCLGSPGVISYDSFMKTTTLPIRNSVNRSLLGAFVLIAVTFACFALAPATDAQCPQICDSSQNTAVGDSALINNTTGFENTAIGHGALLYNTTGATNTAIGFQTLFTNTSSINNTAIGFSALFSNTTGGGTAVGSQALYSNTTGFSNTAIGGLTLQSNTTGWANTAVGEQALLLNTTGVGNTATGVYALFFNTTGNDNTASGEAALDSNTTGNENTALGHGALLYNTTGFNNTAVGSQALHSSTLGSSNIALGYQAGENLTTGSNNIDIGNAGANESSKIRIGTNGIHTNTYIAGISGVTVPSGVGVIIDGRGHLGTVVSSERFKDEIKPMDKASEAVLALKPVTFRYKHDLDPDGIPQFGLVAEDVEKVNPDLVARDEQGKPYSVRYEAVNAMLLNEFLKEHKKVQELEAKLVQQEKDFAARLKQLDSKIQTVNDKVELSKPAARTVKNNQ